MEKIKVNLSYNTYNLLIHDMESFSFNMKDNIPNRNLFYNILCKEMYNIKKKESEELRERLSNILQNNLNNYNIINDILNDIEDVYNYKNFVNKTLDQILENYAAADKEVTESVSGL